MPWQTEMVETVRVCINDMSTSPAYTDNDLIRLIIVSARMVANEPGITFTQTYTIDIDEPSINPEPTDISFINLTCIKAACIVERGAAKKASGQAIAIKDGSSAIDLRGNLEGALKLLQINWCKSYNDEKIAYARGQVAVAGVAILSPFRIYSTDYVFNDIGRNPWPT